MNALEPVRSVDVLVVGAGPVGLALAHELALRHCSVLVVDRAGAAQETRSMGLHVRTMAVLAMRGIDNDLRAAQSAMGELSEFRGGFAGLFLLGRAEVDSTQPRGLGVTREILRNAFAARMAGGDVEVRYDTEFRGYTERGGSVRVTLCGPAGEHHVDAAFLVGCDGGSSAVRRAAGIPFEGTGASVVARLATVDAEDVGGLPMGWHRTATGWIARLPFRRVLTLEWGAAPRASIRVTPDDFAASVDRVTGRTVVLGHARDITGFTDAARQASRYRAGRVLVVGDAAHIHLPVGGQGVNLGLQDAMNLGWKLGLVCSGRAPLSLLDTYHDERHPVGAEVLRNTRAQSALMRPGPHTDALRELVAELLTDNDDVNRLITRRIDGRAVRYPGLPDDHPLVGSFAFEDPALLPVHNRMRTGRALFITAQDNPLAQRARRWGHIVDQVDANGSRAVLVRPDGYIAWVADSPVGGAAPDLERALGTWFGCASDRRTAGAPA